MPTYDFGCPAYFEADPGRVDVGTAGKVLDAQTFESVEAGVWCAAPEADLGWLLQDAIRRIGGNFGELGDVTALVGEGGHNAPHPPRGRLVELQAHLDGLSYLVRHSSYILRPRHRRCTWGAGQRFSISAIQPAGLFADMPSG